MTIAPLLLEKLTKTDDAIARASEALAAAPNDILLRSSLASLQSVSAQLENQWMQACRDEAVDVLRYRLIANDPNSSFTVNPLTETLRSFQELFSIVFDALSNGPKDRARISQSTRQETAFGFRRSYAGSLGVVLTLPSERDLFASKFNDAAEAVFQIMDVDGEHEVRDLADRLGTSVVRRVYDWTSANYMAGYDLDVSWQLSHGPFIGRYVDNAHFERLTSTIANTSDTESNPISFFGVLLAMDVKRKTFRLVDPEGADITGKLADNFPYGQEWAVNKKYHANVIEERSIVYATQEERLTYTLTNLKPSDDEHAVDA